MRVESAFWSNWRWVWTSTIFVTTQKPAVATSPTLFMALKASMRKSSSTRSSLPSLSALTIRRNSICKCTLTVRHHAVEYGFWSLIQFYLRLLETLPTENFKHWFSDSVLKGMNDPARVDPVVIMTSPCFRARFFNRLLSTSKISADTFRLGSPRLVSVPTIRSKNRQSGKRLFNNCFFSQTKSTLRSSQNQGNLQFFNSSLRAVSWVRQNLLLKMFENFLNAQFRPLQIPSLKRLLHEILLRWAFEFFVWFATMVPCLSRSPTPHSAFGRIL